MFMRAIGEGSGRLGDKETGRGEGGESSVISWQVISDQREPGERTDAVHHAELDDYAGTEQCRPSRAFAIVALPDSGGWQLVGNPGY